VNNEVKQQTKTIKLIQKYKLEKVEELVLIKAIQHHSPIPFLDDNLDIDNELEYLEIDSPNNLKKLYKGLRVIVSIWDTGCFEGIILTINQGKLYLEIEDFYGEVHDCVDYSDCYQGVHSFGIDEIYELSILKQR
jgi:hypothetical protein